VLTWASGPISGPDDEQQYTPAVKLPANISCGSIKKGDGTCPAVNTRREEREDGLTEVKTIRPEERGLEQQRSGEQRKRGRQFYQEFLRELAAVFFGSDAF